MQNFKDRLIILFGENTGPTQIAKEIGMTFQGFTRVWYSGGIPKADTLINIQDATGCDLNWLLTGKGEPFPNKKHQTPPEVIDSVTTNPMVYDTLGYEVDLNEFVFIPRYDVYASAGNGHFNGNEKPMHTMAFRRDWVLNVLMADPADLFVITVKGDSMPGVVEDKDVILVNRANKPGNGVYLVRVAEELIVKHVQTMPGGDLLVKSTNDIYEQFTIDASPKFQDVSILGEVMWLARTL